MDGFISNTDINNIAKSVVNTGTQMYIKIWVAQKKTETLSRQHCKEMDQMLQEAISAHAPLYLTVQYRPDGYLFTQKTLIT